jgi:hypothetical protein
LPGSGSSSIFAAADLIETTRSGPPAEAGTSDIGTWKAGTEALLSEMNISQNSLRTLAEGTGGFAGVNTNSLVDVFDRIVEANSRYYPLGYNPPTHPRDGRFHKIEVRVTRPGLKVTARKGYPSPHGRSAEERRRDDEAKRLRDSRKGGANNTSPELRDILNAPVQQPDLPLTVQAAAFRSTPTEAQHSLSNGGTDSAKSWNTYVFIRQIPLKDIPPGRYLLRVEARDRARTNVPPAASERR